MKKQSTFKMKGPGQKSPAKAIGGGNYVEGFKKMTTKQLFDVVKRNDRGLESGRKEIVKRTQEKGDANSIYQAMTANDSTNTAKRVIRQRIKKGTFDDGSLKKGENPFKMKGFGGFGNSPVKEKTQSDYATREMQRQYNIYDRQRGKKVTYENAWKGMGAVERKKHNNDYDTFVKAAKKYNAEKKAPAKMKKKK